MPSKRWRVAAAMAPLAAAAAAWWLSSRPRTLTVCIFPDYTFRQRAGWRETLETRMAAVSRIWEREVGIQWRIFKIESDDPTAYVPGFETRRIELPHDTSCASDLLLIVTGMREGKLTGRVNPFSHAALIVDAADQTEQMNTRSMSRELTHLFGAPDEAKAPAASGAGFASRTRKLTRRLRDYNFARGVDGLEGSWDSRATDTLVEEYSGVSPHPLAHAHLLMAAALVADGRYNAAIPHLREAVRADPENAAIRLSLASALAQDSQTEAAMAVLGDAIRDFPGNGKLHAALGILVGRNDRARAEEEYRTAVRLEPDNPQLYSGLGYILIDETGHLDDAVAMFQNALKIDPELRVTQEGLVKALQLRAKVHTELDRYHQLARVEPGSARAQYNLGVAEIHAGNFEDAARAFTRAIALNPAFGEAHANLAWMRFALNDFQGSWQEVRKAQSLGNKMDRGFIAKLKEKAPQ